MAARVRWGVLFAGVCLVAAAPDASARERVSCVTIGTDESVAAVARRVTGDARNMDAPWFQIVNPTTSRAVPKSRYGFLFAGWKACTTVEEPRPLLASNVSELALETAAPLPSNPAGADTPPATLVVPALAATLIWAPAALWGTVVLGLAFVCWLTDHYMAGRQRTLRAMQAYADRFVEEFERPLIQPHLERRPIQSRVRFRPGRARFDVMLAPDAGLRYPNLADHKKNVMYDVVRIQQALSPHAFVSSRPYARGRWVVVPFRFRVPSRETREAGER
jgi:hypothetical protein